MAVVDKNSFCEVYSGSSLLHDLKFQSVSGQYKNFTKMSFAEFYLINLVGSRFSKKTPYIGKPVQKKVSHNFSLFGNWRFLCKLQYLFKVFKQSVKSSPKFVLLLLINLSITFRYVIKI